MKVALDAREISLFILEHWSILENKGSRVTRIQILTHPGIELIGVNGWILVGEKECLDAFKADVQAFKMKLDAFLMQQPRALRSDELDNLS